MVFQEPMTSLNPLHTIGRQVGEAVTLHQPMEGAALRARVLDLLRKVGLPQRGGAAERLPAPALRRAAAAGDDRGRPRQRARSS
jgi:microcin C transport system ATP-binding protein